MIIHCLDLEGVLVPEIWIRVAQHTGIKELRLTTRDIKNYDTLMKYRLRILKKHGIRLRDIQKVIGRIRPLPGAKQFLKRLQAVGPVIILSDTFYEFAGPLMKQLGYPTLFCNWLKVDRKGFVTGYVLRQKNGKEKAVRALRKAGFKIRASGDSYNDLTMLKSADRGILFKPPTSIVKEYPRFPVTRDYRSLFRKLTAV